MTGDVRNQSKDRPPPVPQRRGQFARPEFATAAAPAWTCCLSSPRPEVFRATLSTSGMTARPLLTTLRRREGHVYWDR
jgi:hypothetical protein